MKIVFSERAWEDYLHWRQHDVKLLRKFNGLIQETCRTPFAETGKPEPLKNELAGWGWRRIDQEHRFVYRVRDDRIEILQCRLHY